MVTTSGGGGGAQVQDYLRNYGNTVGAQCVGGVDAKSPLKPADVAAAAALMFYHCSGHSIIPEKTG